MSDIDLADHTSPDLASPPELGHPVRSFVLVMLGLSVLLAAIQWSGIVAPDLRAATMSSGSTVDGREYFALLLANDSRLPARVEDVAFVGRGWTDVTVVVQRAGDGIEADIGTTDRVEELRLDGGRVSTRWIVVAGRRPCDQSSIARIDIVVRAWAGTRRTRSFVVSDPATADAPCTDLGQG